MERLIPFRRKIFHINHRAVRRLLYRPCISLSVIQRVRIAGAQSNDIVSSVSGRIENRNAVSVLHQSLLPFSGKSSKFSGKLSILPFCHLINLMDRRSRKDIVELVDQNLFPHSLQLFCRVRNLILRKHRQQFQIHQAKLGFPVRTFVSSHGSQRSSVVFKIEFPFPYRQPGAVSHTFLQLIKVGPGKFLADHRNPPDSFFHAQGSLQHLPGRPAASVPITVGNQNIIVDVLVLVAHPSAHNRVRVQSSVVSGKKIMDRLMYIESCNQVSQHLTSVNSSPHHRVVRNLIELIPRQLCGHKVIDPAFLHDLRQGSRITEYVRQPQNPVINAELLFEKTFSVHELAHQGLSGSQIAVRLNPHAALRLPAFLFYTFFDPSVQLRISLLQKHIQLRLAGHEFVVGIFLHQLQHGGKASSGLFLRLFHGPPPRHIDMRMADAGCNHISVSRHIRIQRLINVIRSLLQGPVKLIRIRSSQIQIIDCTIQNILNILPIFIVFLHPGKCRERHPQIVVQLFDFVVNLLHICKQIELCMFGPRISLKFQGQRLPCLCFRAEEHIPVVQVNALHHCAIHKQKKLWIFRVKSLFHLCPHMQPHPFSVQFPRHRILGAEPVVTVRPIPVHGLAIKRLPRNRICVGVRRADIIPFFVLPVPHRKTLFYLQFLQLTADHADSLVQKIHSSSFHSPQPFTQYRNTYFAVVSLPFSQVCAFTAQTV